MKKFALALALISASPWALATNVFDFTRQSPAITESFTYCNGRTGSNEIEWDRFVTVRMVDMVPADIVLQYSLTFDGNNRPIGGSGFTAHVKNTNASLTTSLYRTFGTNCARGAWRMDFRDGSRWNNQSTSSAFNFPSARQALAGGSRAGTLNATQSVAVLQAGTAGDRLNSASAGNSNTTLISGAGNDDLNGNRGNDVYVFNERWGYDLISELGGFNIVVLDVGPEKVTLRREESSLLILKNGTTDKIKINRYFQSAANEVAQIKFVNGVVYNKARIAANLK